MSGQPPLPNQGAATGRDPTQPGTRFFSEEFADIAKLRARAQKESTRAMKLRHKSAHQITSMEAYRHKATVMKEKAAITRDKIPAVEDRMKEFESDIKIGAQGVPSGGVRPRDQSKLHVKIRKLQEKVVALQRKAVYYESKATQYLSISSLKKVKADMFEEKAKEFDFEASNLASRADRLQKATEGDVAAVSRR